MKPLTDQEINIHYDCDGVLRDFHSRALDLFFLKYPEYKKYRLPLKKLRGWYWGDQLKEGPDKDKIAGLMDFEIFGDLCYDSFCYAESFYTPNEWWSHIDSLRRFIPNANITISTHQYNDDAREATIKWLHKNQYTRGDEINILFTGRKTSFDAHFLLDDKPGTIEGFLPVDNRVGVLYLNPTSNGWYLRKHNNKLSVPFANNLDGFLDIVLEHVAQNKLFENKTYI